MKPKSTNQENYQGLPFQSELCAETLDAVRAIQRGLDEMQAGQGKPFRQALDEIRARHKIPLGKN